jgi:hypothetical protein
MRQVASSAYLDENITFAVNDEDDASKKIERVPLSTPEPPKTQSKDVGISPSTSEDSSATTAKQKRTSRLRQCKCFMKRISRSILGKK